MRRTIVFFLSDVHATGLEGDRVDISPPLLLGTSTSRRAISVAGSARTASSHRKSAIKEACAPPFTQWEDAGSQTLTVGALDCPLHHRTALRAGSTNHWGGSGRRAERIAKRAVRAARISTGVDTCL